MALSFSEVKCYSDDIIHWRSVSTIQNSAVAKLKNLESDKNSCLVAKREKSFRVVQYETRVTLKVYLISVLNSWPLVCQQ